MSLVNELSRKIDQLQAYKTDLRKRERSLAAREKALSDVYQVPGEPHGIRKNMMGGLPMHLVPLNVGALNSVAWPFFYNVRFNATAVASITQNLRYEQSFQVSQEAAFIITKMSYNFKDGMTPVNEMAPWFIEVRDRQSTRLLNSAPFPVQSLGTKGNPTVLPTPYLIMPTAFLDVTLSAQPVVTYAVAPEDLNLEITFEGLRMRIEDAASVLSTIYSNK